MLERLNLKIRLSKSPPILLSYLILTASIVSSCKLTDNQIKGSLQGDIPSTASPNITFQSMPPSLTNGNSSTTFIFNLTYSHTDTVNLTQDYVTLVTTGNVNCDLPTIINGTTISPNISLTNCTGDGSAKITLNAGSGTGEPTSDTGAESPQVNVDNTAPTVNVAAPIPSSGDSSTTFVFAVAFSEANTIYLVPGNITVNGGLSCNPATVTNGTSAAPTVSLTNCTGTGTVGITIQPGSASDLATNGDSGSAPSSTASVTNSFSCPTGYIRVPALSGYTSLDFCVMKYEAKVERDSDQVIHDWGCDNDLDATTGNGLCSGVGANWVLNLPQPSTPASVPDGRPWRKIDRDNSIAECQSLGANYDLITNDEWQTIARNIELNSINWSSGSVGSGEINRGHADGTPNEPVIASGDENDSCINTGQEVNTGIDDSCPGAGAGWHAEKRTHTLSNGNVIWDIAGNSWEWVKDTSSNSYGPDDYVSQVTTGSPYDNLYSLSGGTTTTARKAKDQFGPSGNYTPLNSGNRGGLGMGFLSPSSGAIIRGGDWADGNESGVFTTYPALPAFFSLIDVGFRCVYHQ